MVDDAEGHGLPFGRRSLELDQGRRPRRAIRRSVGDADWLDSTSGPNAPCDLNSSRGIDRQKPSTIATRPGSIVRSCPVDLARSQLWTTTSPRLIIAAPWAGNVPKG